MAHRGTLFLDEIGEMAPNLQAKLLRVSQDRVIRRVGSEESFEVDVRLMSATSRDLEAALADGSFRTDLYYRLAVVTLLVPPLRQRPYDVERLLQESLRRFGRRQGRPELRLASEARDALVAYAWPGNVRELLNVAERAAVLARDEVIELHDLPADLRPGRAREETDAISMRSSPAPPEWLGVPLREARIQAVERFERDYLVAQLRACRGRIEVTARRCGLSARSLYTKMKHHDLRKEDFRPR